MVDQEPEMSGRELSRRVCDLLNWRSLNDKRKDMSCRVALLRLEREGKIQMRPAGAVSGGEKRDEGERGGEGGGKNATPASGEAGGVVRGGRAGSGGPPGCDQPV